MPQAAMKNFASNEDLFQAVSEFVNELESQGFVEASDNVRQGFSSLNGLTDGGALLEESLREVKTQQGDELSEELQSKLDEILSGLTGIVYR